MDKKKEKNNQENCFDNELECLKSHLLKMSNI